MRLHGWTQPKEVVMAVDPVGQTYRTGDTAPVSGIYESVGHTDGSACVATTEERQIPLERGETFPPHRSESKGVLWRYLRSR